MCRGMCGYGHSAVRNCLIWVYLSFQFFSPIQPVRVNFEFGSNGRPSGEANVDFATHQEAMEAMKKHKSNMRKYALIIHVQQDNV